MLGVLYNGCKCISILFDLPAELSVGGMSTKTCSLTSVLLSTVVRVSRRSSQGVSGENMSSGSTVKSSLNI